MQATSSDTLSASLVAALPGLRIRRTRRPSSSIGRGLRAVVAIPLRDEELHVARCLAAFTTQRELDGTPIPGDRFEIILLLNNCHDASFEAAVAAACSLPLRVSVVEVELPADAAHVGWARRLACDAAADILAMCGDRDAVLSSTDADSAVRPRWLATAARAIERGADAVAGAIIPDPADLRALDPQARARLMGERRYGHLLERLATLVDPEPHDPWPRHSFHCGASMAVRPSIYRAVGGLPPVPVGEDRAFFAELTLHDHRIRHCPEVAVRTSCRTIGRAAGGMADALARWSLPPAQTGDEIVSVLTAFSAFRLRAELRAAYRRGGAPEAGLARRLALPPSEIDALLRQPSFGMALKAAVERSPAFHHRRLPACRLVSEIAAAERAVGRLAGGQASR